MHNFALELVKDPAVNSKWVPDSLEVKMYEKTFSTALNSIGKASDTTYIKIANHKLGFYIIPDEDSDSKEEEK